MNQASVYSLGIELLLPLAMTVSMMGGRYGTLAVPLPLNDPDLVCRPTEGMNVELHSSYKTGIRMCCITVKCSAGTQAVLCNAWLDSAKCRQCPKGTYQTSSTNSADMTPCEAKRPCPFGTKAINEESRTEDRRCVAIEVLDDVEELEGQAQSSSSSSSSLSSQHDDDDDKTTTTMNYFQDRLISTVHTNSITDMPDGSHSAQINLIIGVAILAGSILLICLALAALLFYLGHCRWIHNYLIIQMNKSCQNNNEQAYKAVGQSEHLQPPTNDDVCLVAKYTCINGDHPTPSVDADELQMHESVSRSGGDFSEAGACSIGFDQEAAEASFRLLGDQPDISHPTEGDSIKYIDLQEERSLQLIEDPPLKIIRGRKTCGLTAYEAEQLRLNRVYLVEKLDVAEPFLSLLLVNHTITVEMKEQINAMTTQNKKADELLNLSVKRGSQTFKTLVFSLVYTKQKHLADLLDTAMSEEFQNFISSGETVTPKLLSFGNC